LKEKTSNFKILIAGKGNLETELTNLVTKNNLEKRFRFVGFVDDMKGFMHSVDIFVLTSIWERFGYVLVEAMASYIPVVAFEISSNPEIEEHNKTGYLVPLRILRSCMQIIRHYLIDDQNYNSHIHWVRADRHHG
jgi:glycosyltransferase involved in cell wall biosynthesis